MALAGRHRELVFSRKYSSTFELGHLRLAIDQRLVAGQGIVLLVPKLLQIDGRNEDASNQLQEIVSFILDHVDPVAQGIIDCAHNMSATGPLRTECPQSLLVGAGYRDQIIEYSSRTRGQLRVDH